MLEREALGGLRCAGKSLLSLVVLVECTTSVVMDGGNDASSRPSGLMAPNIRSTAVWASTSPTSRT